MPLETLIFGGLILVHEMAALVLRVPATFPNRSLWDIYVSPTLYWRNSVRHDPRKEWAALEGTKAIIHGVGGMAAGGQGDWPCCVTITKQRAECGAWLACILSLVRSRTPACGMVPHTVGGGPLTSLRPFWKRSQQTHSEVCLLRASKSNHIDNKDELPHQDFMKY